MGTQAVCNLCVCFFNLAVTKIGCSLLFATSAYIVHRSFICFFGVGSLWFDCLRIAFLKY